MGLVYVRDRAYEDGTVYKGNYIYSDYKLRVSETGRYETWSWYYAPIGG